MNSRTRITLYLAAGLVLGLVLTGALTRRATDSTPNPTVVTAPLWKATLPGPVPAGAALTDVTAGNSRQALSPVRSEPLAVAEEAEGPRQRALESGQSPDPQSAHSASDRSGRSLTGRVFDASDGSPVVGATLVLSDSSTVETQLDGSFRFEGLPEEGLDDSEQLAVSHPEYAHSTHSVEWKPNSQPLPLEIGVERARPIPGRVFDPAGRAVAGARLEWRFRHPGQISPGESTVSDAQGEFTVTLPPELPTFLHESLDLVVSHSDFASSRFAATALQERIEVGLSEGASLSGRVTGEQGEALPGARVLAERFDEQWTSSADGEGRYHLEHLEPGRYTLHVGAAGHAPTSVAELELTAGPNARDLRLAAGGRLTGIVQGSDGVPVRGVEVRVRDARVSPATTDAEGHYELLDLPTDTRISLTAEAEGFVSSTLDNQIAGSPAAPIVLLRESSLRGRVLDSSNRQALATFHLVARRIEAGGPAAAIVIPPAGADGEFAHDALAPGEYRLSLRHEGCLTAQTTVVLREAETTTSELFLERGIEASGTVVDALSGEAVVGARVVFHLAEGASPSAGLDPPRATKTDEQGRFHAAGLRPGVHSVIVSAAEGQGHASSRVDLLHARSDLQFELASFLPPPPSSPEPR